MARDEGEAVNSDVDGDDFELQLQETAAKPKPPRKPRGPRKREQAGTAAASTTPSQPSKPDTLDRKPSKKKAKLQDLSAQDDPKAPLDRELLLRAAQPVLKQLAADLWQRAGDSPAVTAALSARHAAEVQAGRTAEAYAGWLRAFVEQVAAGWLLSCVFVRVLEDRGLLDHRRIAGRGALDSQQQFFELAPNLSERDYLRMVFRELSAFPASARLFDRHNPVWLLMPSAQGAQALLALFRTPSPHAPALRFGQEDTRFLGDLYQDLSEDVRKRYALLQTPDFVEQFILDRTLEPALARFGLDQTTLIDPTCGSGHFLLGTFQRLLDHRLRAEPGLSVPDAAHKALDAVSGTDINPYAIAIARFRLVLAYLEATQLDKLHKAPALPLHLAVADSLLHNPQGKLAFEETTSQADQMSLGEAKGVDRTAFDGDLYALEDPEATREVLSRRYAAVVGNPPYITVKDKALRDSYRARYVTCHREYSLAVPFKERFFQLARPGGSVGMITANSFMKREFGKMAIEYFLPRVHLTLIVNTSGAYIPGHGTPTVMLFGNAEAPTGPKVRTVLARRGEPTTPEDPAQGKVWSSIASHWDNEGFENEFISVAGVDRSELAKHPWSLAGGGAGELKALLEERASTRLGQIVDAIGFVCMTRADDIYFTPRDALRRAGISDRYIIENVEGECVRDWAIQSPNTTVFPYDDDLQPTRDDAVHRFLWPYRTILWLRREPNGNHKEIGLTWWEWSRFQRKRYTAPFRIAFAFVATHNHFVLDRGGKVFNRTAPIIKLPANATEDDHLALLAYLNSSTACFWMKQVFHNKSNASQKHSNDPARAAYEFAGTGLELLPLFKLPAETLDAARELDQICRDRGAWVTGSTFKLDARSALSSREAFESYVTAGWSRYDEVTARAVYLQEEIDWSVYQAAGLWPSAEPNFNKAGAARLGTRPFELQAGYDAGVSERATQVASLPEAQASIPDHWRSRIPATQKGVLKTIEAREYKRMWRDTEQNIDQRVFRAQLPTTWVRLALAEALEEVILASPHPQTPSSLVTQLDHAFLSTAADVLSGDGGELIRENLAYDSVPFLDIYTYTASGLEKRRAWQKTWTLQRQEDQSEASLSVPIPPPYSQGSRGKSSDFQDAVYWRLRGKLDVPKERFISYPGCESDEDDEPIYGWAGWDHLQRAQALAGLYEQRKAEGWERARLTPMLAGLLELLPWLKQWHNAPNAEFDGMRLGDYFEGYLDGECAALELSRQDLRDWRPATKTRRGPKGSKRKRSGGGGG